MSTIAITGATGFVGSHLRPALEAAGHDVRPLSVRSGISPADVSGAAAVIHLAGESVSGRWTAAKRAAILESRRTRHARRRRRHRRRRRAAAACC